jgi:pyruvate-formate lyase
VDIVVQRGVPHVQRRRRRGCLDRLLLPFYERESAEGRLDDETAVYCLACLLLNDTKYYQLGGPLPDGRDGTNRLSFLVLEAAHRLRIACNLTIRVHETMDPALFELGVRYLFEDRLGFPRFCGDKGLTQGFARNGFSLELARSRVAVGCHWNAIPGREYTLNDCVKINCAKVFEAAFAEMVSAGAEPSVRQLWTLYTRHLDRAIDCTARGLDFHMAHQRDNQPELVISLLCHGTVESGRDATEGGVEFYNLCVDGSALATVADSFAALEQRIEREGRMGWEGIARHIRESFSGEEGERVRLMMKQGERYGSGNGLGDAWARRISSDFTRRVTAAPTPGGYRMLPGWFSWSNTLQMGRELGATPNGRRAGEPISHGANPDPGFRKDGAPTAMVKAIAAIQPGYGNTAPIQMEIDPGLSREQGGLSGLQASFSPILTSEEHCSTLT